MKSAANTARFHNPILADPAQAVAYIEREWEPAKVRRRYDWLFEYDAMPVGRADAPRGRPVTGTAR